MFWMKKRMANSLVHDVIKGAAAKVNWEQLDSRDYIGLVQY